MKAAWQRRWRKCGISFDESLPIRLRKLENFGFIVNEKDFSSRRPVYNFSSLGLSVSPSSIKDSFEETFQDSDEKPAHYWLDTSILIRDASVYGIHDGKRYRLSEPSVLNACSLGLEDIAPECIGIWKEINEIKHVYESELEKIINRIDVSIPKEVIDEFRIGEQFMQEFLKYQKKPYENNVHAAHRKMIQQDMQHRKHLIDVLERKYRSDLVIRSIDENDMTDVFNFCSNIAQEKGFEISYTDKKQIAMTLCNSMIRRGEQQVLVTRDNGIVLLAEEISRRKDQSVVINTSIKYSEPLKFYHIEESVTKCKEGSGYSLVGL